MNRQERRKLKKQGIQVPKDPSINIKLSDLGRDIMTPTMEQAMMHEINQQCLEADKRFSLDLDTMVIWTLYQCYGWREKRLHDFYLAMAKEHRRMREFYEMDDLYPERYKLKEKGIDIEKWQEEVLNNDPTAYNALRPIMQEDAALEGKVNFLIKVLKFIIAESGFELLARIEIKDKKTGRCFR